MATFNFTAPMSLWFIAENTILIFRILNVNITDFDEGFSLDGLKSF